MKKSVEGGEWVLVQVKVSGVSPWLHAFFQGRNGDLQEQNYEDLLKAQGFQLRRKSVQWFKFAGTCKEYTLELCGFLRIAWFLKDGGKGYGWEIWWNFGCLKRVIKELTKARKGQRQYFTNDRRGLRQHLEWRRLEASKCGIADPRMVKVTKEQRLREAKDWAEFEKHEAIIGKYSLALWSHLIRQDPILRWPYVAIPGLEGVPSDQLNLVMKLHRILAEWPLKHLETRGALEESRTLEVAEKRLVTQLYKKGSGAYKIAAAIMSLRVHNDADESQSEPLRHSTPTFLVSSVKREINHQIKARLLVRHN